MLGSSFSTLNNYWAPGAARAPHFPSREVDREHFEPGPHLPVMAPLDACPQLTTCGGLARFGSGLLQYKPPTPLRTSQDNKGCLILKERGPTLEVGSDRVPSERSPRIVF